MRNRAFILALTLALAATASTTVTTARAFTDEEHRHLALHAFVAGIEQITRVHPRPSMLPIEVRITPNVLAEISVRSSRDDMSPSRYQVRGMLVHEQAEVVTTDRMAEIVRKILENPPTDNVFGPYEDNVVANYLVYHTIALHCAQKAHAEGVAVDPPPRVLVPVRSEWIEHALVFEAVALGYLADSFSSSHLLTPIHLPLSSMQDANVRAAHEFFATQGAYVWAGGDVWRAFGDGLLQWYGPSYEHVVAACNLSVEQVAKAARYDMDVDHRVRTVIGRIPTVIVAAYHHHSGYYPRFRENLLTDRGLVADSRFLHPRTAYPKGWQLFGEDQNPADLVPNEPAVAAVEFHQTLDFPPAFAGLLLMTGGGVLVKDDGGGPVGSVAVGYAWATRVPLLSQVRTSLEMEYVYRLGDPDRRVIVPRYGVGLGSPIVPGVEAMHFEVGYAWGLHGRFRDQGVKWGVGFGTKPLRLPFTYAGVSARIKYERFWIEEGLDGFQLQLIFR